MTFPQRHLLLFLLVESLAKVLFSMRLYFASHDGQTRLIVHRLAARLANAGWEAAPFDLSFGFPEKFDLARDGMVVLVAAVRYGRHLAAADRLLALCHDLPPWIPLAVASVNLTARKPGRDTLEGNPYLKRWLARRRVRPILATAFAGRLDYPRYGWFDRQVIRLIMRITGGPTDPSTKIEYTDWKKVDAFADAVSSLLAKGIRPKDSRYPSTHRSA